MSEEQISHRPQGPPRPCMVLTLLTGAGSLGSAACGLCVFSWQAHKYELGIEVRGQYANVSIGRRAVQCC